MIVKTKHLPAANASFDAIFFRRCLQRIFGERTADFLRFIDTLFLFFCTHQLRKRVVPVQYVIQYLGYFFRASPVSL